MKCFTAPRNQSPLWGHSTAHMAWMAYLRKALGPGDIEAGSNKHLGRESHSRLDVDLRGRRNATGAFSRDRIIGFLAIIIELPS